MLNAHVQRTSAHETWKLNYLVKCDMNPKQCTAEASKEWKESEREKNWIVNRSNDNRMIGANNNTCTHQRLQPASPFSRCSFLYWVLSDARVWLWFTFYNWNHWYRDLCWLRNASMEFSYNFKLFRPNASQQTPFSAHPDSVDSSWFAILTLHCTIFFFFPQFVCGRCVHWFKPNKLNTFKWRQSIFNQIIIFIRNTNPWKCWMRQTFKIAFDYYPNYSCILTKVRINKS